MARGWESKSIESQQEERLRASQPRRRPSAEAGPAAALDRRRTLELARARVLADLQASASPRHRALLERSVAAIEQQLDELSRVLPKPT
jgi:hypothetical protein